MSLFNVTVSKKNASPHTPPVWQSEIDADNLEEAYRIGKTQFLTAHPDKHFKDYTVKAAGYSVEKSIQM